MYTPPHRNKASTNLNVSKALMELNLALNAFIFPISARSPTYTYFVKLAFFLGSCQPTAHCSTWRGRVKDSIVCQGVSAWREVMSGVTSWTSQACCHTALTVPLLSVHVSPAPPLNMNTYTGTKYRIYDHKKQFLQSILYTCICGFAHARVDGAWVFILEIYPKIKSLKSISFLGLILDKTHITLVWVFQPLDLDTS